MKARYLFPLLAVAMFTGCNDANTPPGNNPATAPTDYLKDSVSAQKKATKTIDATAMNKVLDQFYVQEGRFPKDLQELVDKKYLPFLPTLPDGAHWDYDTNSGIVKIQKN